MELRQTEQKIRVRKPEILWVNLREEWEREGRIILKHTLKKKKKKKKKKEEGGYH